MDADQSDCSSLVPLEIDISITQSRWEKLPFNVESCIQEVCKRVLQKIIQDPKPFVLSILLTDDQEIQELNKNYRGKEGPTNILSFGVEHFPMKGEISLLPLGDLALSYERIEEEARAQGKTFQNHFIHLIIHGMLHLLGFDHGQEAEAKEMETIEVELLRSHFGIPNPYE